MRETVFSECRKYRYALWRSWGGPDSPYVMFIGLNPSTANETVDDPTVRKCIRYARDWGFASLCIGNLFAICSKDRSVILAADDPIGLDNDKWLTMLSQHASLTVAAWGNSGSYQGRASAVIKTVPNLRCLRMTKRSQPAHPLYLPSSLLPVALDG